MRDHQAADCEEDQQQRSQRVAGPEQSPGATDSATFQDRLRKEMRLAGIDSLEQANLFLETFIPAYNQRFAKPARDPQSAWRPLPPELDLDRLFSTATERKVKVDHIISFRGLTLQIRREKHQPCLVACKVMVHVTPESELHLYHQDTKLAYRRLDHAATTPLAKPSTPSPRYTPRPPDAKARRRRNAYLFGNY